MTTCLFEKTFGNFLISLECVGNSQNYFFHQQIKIRFLKIIFIFIFIVYGIELSQKSYIIEPGNIACYIVSQNHIILFYTSILYTLLRNLLCISPIYFSYLALQAGMSSGSDYVFIPEDPAPENWTEHLCEKLLEVRWLQL